MSFATATTWVFNFIVALTFPRLLSAFTRQGAFGWYAGCASPFSSFPPSLSPSDLELMPLTPAGNVIGTFLVLFFVPETKGLSLEELDQGASPPRSPQLSLACLLTLVAVAVFSVPTKIHATYHLKGLGYVSPSLARPRSGPARADPDPLSLARRSYNFRKYILRQRLPPRKPLYSWEDTTYARD